MEETKKMMVRYGVLIYLFLFGYSGCSQPNTLNNSAEHFYKNNRSVSFKKFKNWEIYPRSESDNQYLICDYSSKDEVTIRFLVFNDGSKSYMKSIFPFKDDFFQLIEEYPKGRLL